MNSRFSRLLGLFSPFLVVAAGCGGGNYSPNPTNSTFSITPSTTTADTNQQVQLKATLNAGGAANVHWAVLSGQNDSNIGQGSIDQTGLYTPPPALTHDSVQVKLQANLISDIYTTLSAVITVTPGFNQAVAPEVAAVAPGSTVPFTGVIAEYGGGSINWSLSSAANAVTNPGSNYGTISGSKCQTSSQNYTFCTATYTAPAGTAPSGPLYAYATVAANSQSASYAKLLLNNAGVNTSPLDNQAAQTGTVEMGTSGGNTNDFDLDSTGQYITDCASGTLGALVADQNNNQYILSNNHVLAESDQGTTTDSIIQPGLVDTGCSPLGQPGSIARGIGTLQYSVPLNTTATNVDAALASAASGTVDVTGGILGLGTGGSNGQLGAAPPAGGTGEPLTAANLFNGTIPIQVVKSGRTTGLTCSTVDSIADSFQVDYYKDAAGTQFYTTKTFTNQIGISGRYFSDFGDSGSLVVDASNAQPVGLFFAGAVDSSGNGFSFANPIGDVLTELSQHTAANGSLQLKVVGGAPHSVTCLNYDTNTASAGAVVAVSAAEAAKARAAANTTAAALVNPANGILGVGTGKSLDQPGRAAVIVYTDRNKPAPTVPQTIAGVPTIVIPTTPASVGSGKAPRSLRPAAGLHLPQAALNGAIAVQREYAAQIMSDPAYIGVGVAESLDQRGEPALLLFVDMNKTPKAEPSTIGGLRTRYVRLHRIRITLGGSGKPVGQTVSGR